MRWAPGLLLLAATSARADERLLTDDTFAVKPAGALVVDAGVIVGMPAALPTGLARGVGVGITHTCGCRLAYGALASYESAAESSETWMVTHSEVRLRATGSVRYDDGRGTLALRLGAGASIVHERRERAQGMRAGLMGSDLLQTGTRALPAVDLEAVVGLRIVGAWGLVVAAGPTVTVLDGGVRGGWTGELGVAWNP